MPRRKLDQHSIAFRTAFGRRIAEARLAAGKEQVEIAKALGAAASQVSEWETGAKLPQVNTVARVAEITGCDLQWLITGKERSLSDVIPMSRGVPEGVSPKAWPALAPILPKLAMVYENRRLRPFKGVWDSIVELINSQSGCIQQYLDFRMKLAESPIPTEILKSILKSTA